MANDKKNNTELVTDDDDPTAELAVVVLQTSDPVPESEAAASTAGFEHGDAFGANGDADIAELRSDLKSQSATVERLQYELAQLHSRDLGLEAELDSRSQVSSQLQSELATARTSLGRKQGLLKKRDQQIKALRLEIRERNAAFRQLQDQIDSLNRQQPAAATDDKPDGHQSLPNTSGHATNSEPVVRELQQRYQRIEEYADQLRQQLQDQSVAADRDRNTRELLQYDLAQASERIVALQQSNLESSAEATRLSEELAALHTTHADEIRTIRFELGSAQETVSQHELLTEQLASDLVETRTYRLELENMLNENEGNNRARIEKLEKENRGLRRESVDLQHKLETKNEAINCLISELAKKSQQVEAPDPVEIAIQEIDERVAERIDNHTPIERDRVTRVLIGSIDNQELRFPLFKDRLTIGRTEQNDIQLKASHISRRHAVIVTEGSLTRVIDWGSKNGVFVNAARVTEHFLKHGDVVSIGTAEFRYEERAKRDARDN